MFLSGQAISEYVDGGTIRIEPFDQRGLRAASYILQLGVRFRRWNVTEMPLDPWGQENADDTLGSIFETNQLAMQPGEFLLGQTVERIGLPDGFAGILSPLSHVARFGLSIHGGADWISPGFGTGSPTHLTLELCNHNASTIILRAKMPICQVRIARVTGDPRLAKRRASIYDGDDPLVYPRYREELGPLFDRNPEGIRRGSRGGRISSRWPPQCCVPAFVDAALRQLGVVPPERTELAKQIGVQVGPNEGNPFGLDTAESNRERGVTVEVATLTINRLLEKMRCDLAFRHIRLHEIALDGGISVLQEALGRQLAVGVGVDYQRISRGPSPETRHVLRVLGLAEQRVTVVDDSGEDSRGTFELPWDELEMAIRAAADGFWILGVANALEFPLTLPWKAGPQ